MAREFWGIFEGVNMHFRNEQSERRGMRMRKRRKSKRKKEEERPVGQEGLTNLANYVIGWAITDRVTAHGCKGQNKVLWNINIS